MSSKNFSDWADVRQLVMEKITNRIQALLKNRETTLTRWWVPADVEGVREDEWAAATEEQRDAWREAARNKSLMDIRLEINRLSKKLVESTEGNLEFDLAAGRLTDFCSR